jgi:two-component system sensor kinase FixL
MSHIVQKLISSTPHHSSRPPSLRRRLLILLGMVLLATLLIIGTGVYYFVFLTEQEAWQGRQGEAARNAVGIVAAFTEHLEDSLTMVGFLDQDYLVADPQGMRGLLQHDPALQEIILLDADGDVVTSAYRDTPLLANLFTIPQSTWFLQASAGETYLGDIQVSPAGDPYLIMAVPGADGAVVAGRLRMSVLWGVVAAIRFGRTGQAYVVNQEGRIVAHTNPEVVLEKTSLAGRPELAALSQSPDRRWNGAYVNFEGTPVVATMAPVPETGWVVITELSQAEAFATSRIAALHLGGSMLLFGVLVMLVTTSLLGRQIFQPMERLRAGAERIGQGDLSHRIEIARQDEVGQVAAAFNEMVGRLGEREDQLAARTAALAAEVDERRRTEEALHRSEALFRAMSEQMPDSLFLLDLDAPDVPAKIIYANEAASHMHGYTLEEMVGRPIAFLDDPATAEKVPGNIERLLAGEIVVFEGTHCRKDGSVFPVEVTSRMIDYGGRKVALAIDRDITEHKQAEAALQAYAAKLERSNRELQDFVFVASHDLQEPLRKVQAFGDRLQNKYSEALGDQGRDYLERMQSAAARMQTQIKDLLAYSRVTTRAQPFTPVDLSKVAQEVMSDLEVRIEQAGGQVEVGGLPTIEADPDQMRQLLQHLIGNALKFHREGEPPVVKIHAESLNGQGEGAAGASAGDGLCQIMVEDNGIGFDEKYLERIFQVFQRLHGRSEYEGTGIGLATCRKIVERHGGSITAKSAPGQGATFIVTLPVTQSKGGSVS